MPCKQNWHSWSWMPWISLNSSGIENWFFLIWGVCKRETSASIDTYNSDEVSCFILPYNRERTAVLPACGKCGICAR